MQHVRETSRKLQRKADCLQFSSILGVVTLIIMTEVVPRPIMKILIWPCIVLLLAVATLGYRAAKVALHYKMSYLEKVIEKYKDVNKESGK